MTQENTITAIVPFDAPLGDGSERGDFMARAQQTIIMPLIDEDTVEGVNEIMRCFDLENADVDATGYVVPIKNRDCAVRLLAVGLLDQTAEDIVERWGPVV